MTDRERDRNAARRLAILRHAREVTGNVSRTCRYYGIIAPDGDSARHLAWLRERLGERFVYGVVFHTEPALYKLDGRIVAVPICALWG